MQTPIVEMKDVAFAYNGEYLDVTTTATFTGNVELCVSYSDDGLTLFEEAPAR